MNKFKKGDRVLIARKSDPPEWDNEWAPEMDARIGEIHTVELPDLQGEVWSYLLEDISLSWPETSLEPVSNKAAAEVILDILNDMK